MYDGYYNLHYSEILWNCVAIVVTGICIKPSLFSEKHINFELWIPNNIKKSPHVHRYIFLVRMTRKFGGTAEVMLADVILYLWIIFLL